MNIIEQLIHNQKDDSPFSNYYPEIIENVFSDNNLLSLVKIVPMEKPVVLYNEKKVAASSRILPGITSSSKNVDVDKISGLLISYFIYTITLYKTKVNNLVFMPYWLMFHMKMHDDVYNFYTRFGTYYEAGQN